jgi:hypothetical protein
VQCPVGQATTTGACAACITGWVPVSNAAGDAQARCEMYVCSTQSICVRPLSFVLASSNWRSATLVCIGAGAVRGQHLIWIRATVRCAHRAKRVFEACAPLVTLEKRLLPTAVHARRALLAPVRISTRQDALTVLMRGILRAGSASSVSSQMSSQLIEPVVFLRRCALPVQSAPIWADVILRRTVQPARLAPLVNLVGYATRVVKLERWRTQHKRSARHVCQAAPLWMTDQPVSSV